jgi:D-amino-acid dehydrogenase
VLDAVLGTVLGQRFINPGEFVHALADSVRARGGKVVDGATVTGSAPTGPSTA